MSRYICHKGCSMDKSLFVIVTYSDNRTALIKIADVLIQTGIPSVHISSPSGQSFYRYKGQRNVSVEYMLDVLCPKELLYDVVKLIKQIHNYELPAITWYEVHAEDDTYDWAIDKEK